MAQHRPIVLRSGRLTELPVGGSLAGMAESLAALPLATWAVPDEFLVQQAGQWVRATHAQMQSWLASAPVPTHGYGILSEAGGLLLSTRIRTAAAALVLSAAGLIGMAVSEGWEPVARPPVPGDVPTGGFGSTRSESGPMKEGERIEPVRGLILLQRDAAEAERIVRRCAPVPMHQREFDAFVSLAYNVGPGKVGVKDGFCELKRGGPPTIVRRLLAGDYTGACDAILGWDKFQGKPLRGLTLRRERERAVCLGVTP